MSLNFKELAQSNREAANGKSEDNGGDASAHPREKGALISQVIASAVGIGVVGQGRYYSTAFWSSAAGPAIFFNRSAGNPCRC